MNEYIEMIMEIGKARRSGSLSPDTIQKLEAFFVCKMIELGAEYSISENGVLSFMIEGNIYSCTRSEAERYMRDDWYKYIFPEEMVFNIDMDEHPSFTTTEQTVAKRKKIDFTTDNVVQMYKTDFSYVAMAIRFFQGQKATKIRVMSAPIDETKTLFWVSMEGQKERLEITNGVMLINVNKAKCIIKREDDEQGFMITATASQGCRIESNLGRGGNGGHMVIYNNGAELHIIPKNYRSDPTGANILFYIKQDGEEYVGEGNTFSYADKDYQIRAWWEGEGEDRILNALVEDI